MATSKSKKQAKSSLERINYGIDAAMKAGLPKETAFFTMMAIEIQVLSNRIEELEKKTSSLK